MTHCACPGAVFAIPSLNRNVLRADEHAVETVTSRKTWAGPFVLAAVVLLAIGAIAIWASGGSSAATTGIAGTGRSAILVTPGGDLTGSLLVPRSIDQGALAWEVREAGKVVDKGAGKTWQAAAPHSGEAELVVLVGGKETARTKIHVVKASDVLGRDVATTGRVLVDGGPVVQGEALPTGTRVDASGGAITFTATARLDSGLSGEIRLEGTSMTLRAKTAADGSVRNVVALDRANAEDSKLLVADVEHLDGTRYVEVETPDAVAMVKGTRFYVRLDADGTDVAVDHGWVVVDSRADVDVPPVDVRDDREAFVPQVAELEAAAKDGGAPPRLQVEAARDFEAVVEEHRTTMRHVADELAQQEADQGATPPAGNQGSTPRPPGQPVSGGPATSTTTGGPAPLPPTPPICDAKCQQTTTATTSGTTTGTSTGTAGTTNGTTTTTTTKPPSGPGTTNGTGTNGSTGSTGTPNCSPTTATCPRPPTTNPPNPNPPTTTNPRPPTTTNPYPGTNAGSPSGTTGTVPYPGTTTGNGPNAGTTTGGTNGSSGSGSTCSTCTNYPNSTVNSSSSSSTTTTGP